MKDSIFVSSSPVGIIIRAFLAIGASWAIYYILKHFQKNETLKGPYDKIFKFLSSITDEKVIDTLTYADVIKYFTEHTPPDDVKFEKGVAIKKNDLNKIIIILGFLDKENKILKKENGEFYAKKFFIKNMDEELIASFGNTDVIIIS